jgi:hypothetical protein
MSSGAGGGGGGSGGPNWLGLLKWSLAHSDGTSGTTVGKMSDADREFLENLMKSMVKDEMSALRDCLAFIHECGEKVGRGEEISEDENDKFLDKVEEIRDITDQVDMAENFVKIGGLDCLMGGVKQRRLPSELRASLVGAFGSISQNHLKIQDSVFKAGFIEALWTELVAVLNSEWTASVDTLAAKIIFGISGSIRGHEAAEQYFLVNCVVPLFQTLYRIIQNQETVASGASSPEISLLFAGLRGFNTNCDNTRALSRLLFLTKALFTSDYANLDRRILFIKCWVPSIYSILTHFTSGEIREICLQLIISILKSDARSYFFESRQTNRSELETVLLAIDAFLQKVDPEEHSVDLESTLVEDIRQELART